MPYKEKDIEKVYFTIGEVADMIDVATSAIRFWGDEFPWTIPAWNKKGHRYYNREKVNEVLKVHFLITCGKTLSGIKEARILGFYNQIISIYEGYYNRECKQI